MDDLICVYESPYIHQISIIKGLLEEQNIESFEVNHTDSTYSSNISGTIELFVNNINEKQALEIIKTFVSE